MASFTQWVGRWLSSAGIWKPLEKFSAEECSVWIDILTGTKAEGAKGKKQNRLESVVCSDERVSGG